MKYKEKHEFYNAEDAAKDSEVKQQESDLFVDHDKMYLITNSIREKIAEFKTQDTSDKNHLHKEVNYSTFLSQGEIQFLQTLGYKVEWIEPQYDQSGYNVISW